MRNLLITSAQTLVYKIYMPRQIKNILVVRTDRFGEFLLNIPAFSALKNKFGNAAEITAVIDPCVNELAKCIPCIDRTILWKRKNNSFAEKVRLIRLLRKKKFDAAVMLNPSKEFNVITFLAGISIRAGYRRKWGFLLTNTMEDSKYLGNKHEIEYNLELTGLLGAAQDNKGLFLSLAGNEADDFFQRLGISETDTVIAIHPWTSDPVKQWPIENFRCLIQRIIGYPPSVKGGIWGDLKIIIVGGGENTVISNKYFSGIGNGRVFDLTGKTTLVQLAALLKKCRLLVSGDSGPLHMACCVHTKVIAIFRNDLPGKSAKRWGPWGQGHTVIEKPGLNDVKVEDVFDKIRESVAVRQVCGWTLAEVLIALAIFAAGIIFVLRSFVTLISTESLSRNMTAACYLAEEKIWEITQDYKKDITAEPSGRQDVFVKEYKWNYTRSITDSSEPLEQLDFNVSWQERAKEKEYNLEFMTYLPKK